MVVHLGAALDVPLRDRNELLMAAGFAPLYSERAWSDGDDPDFAHIRDMLRTLVEAHQPFPAYVVDRGWNVVEANAATGALMARCLPVGADLSVALNAVSVVFEPSGLRSCIMNWTDVASALLARLYRDLDERPGDPVIVQLLDRVAEIEGVSLLPRAQVASARDLLIPVELDIDGERLSLFTTILTIGSPSDITLEELRLESLLPANAASAELLSSITAV